MTVMSMPPAISETEGGWADRLEACGNARVARGEGVSLREPEAVLRESRSLARISLNSDGELSHKDKFRRAAE